LLSQVFIILTAIAHQNFSATFNSQQSTVNSQQSTANSQQPTANSQQTTTH